MVVLSGVVLSGVVLSGVLAEGWRSKQAASPKETTNFRQPGTTSATPGVRHAERDAV